MVADQLASLDIVPEAIIVEPVARNTAPAIAAAAAHLYARDPEAILLVLPSDHVIRENDAFAKAAAIARRAAQAGSLVSFGIRPTAPETGYGYIKSGKPLAGIAGAFAIDRFVEKPDTDTANKYLAEGDWSWNSGMFVFAARQFLEELERFEPALVDAARRSLAASIKEGSFITLDKSAFAEATAKSIDYALMERTEHAAVVPASLGWSDVGAWSALWELGKKDSEGNVLTGDVISESNANSYLRSDGPLLAAFGLKDIVIVATGDVVMAIARDRTQDVKALVTRVRDAGRTETVAHRAINRPWGSFQIIDSGPGFQIVRATVKPGAKLTIEKGSTGTERWVGIAGNASVANTAGTTDMGKNISYEIPPNSLNQLTNPGKAIFEMIVVRCGGDVGRSAPFG